MSLVYSFAPIVGDNPRVLILGSMPGAASLAAGQYYAHPRNQFWRLLQALNIVDCHAGYAERVDMLQQTGFAVWDVLHACEREGSLDTAIQQGSVQSNDFETFLKQYPGIARIYFNGGAAEKFFLKQVVPFQKIPDLAMKRLPSSSPANASFSFERKLQFWGEIIL